jgi:hypothetical protein
LTGPLEGRFFITWQKIKQFQIPGARITAVPSTIHRHAGLESASSELLKFRDSQVSKKREGKQQQSR